MSLTVSVHAARTDASSLGAEMPTPPGSHVAGFESWRRSVYAAAPVLARGACFLPRLRTADLVVEGDDLLPFLRECELLIADVHALAAELAVDAETLNVRLNNLAAATRRALAVSGAIWIS